MAIVGPYQYAGYASGDDVLIPRRRWTRVTGPTPYTLRAGADPEDRQKAGRAGDQAQ